MAGASPARGVAPSADRPQWLGPSRSGVTPEPADNKYREMGRVDKVVRDTCYPHVVLADGIVCCKGKGGNPVCFSVHR